MTARDDLAAAVAAEGALPMPAGPGPMSDERLAELANLRFDEVTPGPWLVGEDRVGRATVYANRTSPTSGHAYPCVLFVADSVADAEFAASARLAVEDLLAEVYRLRRELAAVDTGQHFGFCHTNVKGHRLVNGHCLYCGMPAEEATR